VLVNKDIQIMLREMRK